MIFLCVSEGCVGINLKKATMDSRDSYTVQGNINEVTYATIAW